jgi:hypothetical protein
VPDICGTLQGQARVAKPATAQTKGGLDRGVGTFRLKWINGYLAIIPRIWKEPQRCQHPDLPESTPLHHSRRAHERKTIQLDGMDGIEIDQTLF